MMNIQMQFRMRGRDMNREFSSVVATALLMMQASVALAGPTDAEKCEADKLKRAGQYAFCRMKAEAKAVKKGEAPDYSKCDVKLGDKFTNAELKWGAECLTLGDVGAIQWQVAGDTDDLAVLLSGGSLPPVCGDGTIEDGEECDFGDVNGETCTSLLGVEALGEVACMAGSCTFDTSGCLARYEKQNVGFQPTVVDHATGLEWVVTNNTGGLLDAGNFYRWSTGSNDADGSVFTEYLAGLNGGAYGGHTDWRLPSSGGAGGAGPFEPSELESILDRSSLYPRIDEALFGPTQPGSYWSSSTVAGRPSEAYAVSFAYGLVSGRWKQTNYYVRAVRGGL